MKVAPTSKKSWLHIDTLSGQVVVGVVVALISAFLIWFFTTWFSQAWSFFRTKGWECLQWLADKHQVQGWMIVILCLVAMCFLGVLVMFFLASIKEEKQRHWKEYTHDNFGGIIWRWQYHSDQIYTHLIQPFCPQCDLQIRFLVSNQWPHEIFTTLACSSGCCAPQKISGDVRDVQQDIKLQIERKIRNGEWLGVVERQEASLSQ